MSEIRVDPQFLENLASRLESASRSLRGYSCLDSGRLACTPELDRAYEDLGNKWDEKRNGLAESLDALASGFITTAQSFETADREMGDKLRSGSSGQPQ